MIICVFVELSATCAQTETENEVCCCNAGVLAVLKIEPVVYRPPTEVPAIKFTAPCEMITQPIEEELLDDEIELLDELELLLLELELLIHIVWSPG